MSGEFVARMEDVLDLYQPEYNPERPVVCFDEMSIFMVIRPAIFTDIQPPWERGELTIIRL